MKPILIYPIGSTAACRYAAIYLNQQGFATVDHPTPDATHLLLDVPSFGNDGLLRDGKDPVRVLEMLPSYITVIGGNLDHPALEGYRTIDLLQEEDYLCKNAAITAECALQEAASHLSTTFADTPTLIIGWGRIGKCLGRLLRALGCDVTIAARNPAHRAMAQALGYPTIEPSKLAGNFRLIFNTAPAQVLDSVTLAKFRDSVKIDLASRKGMDGDDVVWARGLPGLYAPESSGRLIGQRVMARIKEA